MLAWSPLSMTADGMAVDQGGDGAEVGLVACGEDERRLRSEEVGDHAPSALVNAVGAVQEPRAGHGPAVLHDAARAAATTRGWRVSPR